MRGAPPRSSAKRRRLRRQRKRRKAKIKARRYRMKSGIECGEEEKKTYWLYGLKHLKLDSGRSGLP